MEVLLRYLRLTPTGGPDFLDVAVTADKITIGSAPDSTVQLLGRSIGRDHAHIDTSGSAPRLRCRGGNRADVNGQRCAAKRLEVGDQIGLGGHRLTLFQPPAGFDLAIEIRPDTSVGADEFEAAFSTDLDRTWLSLRQGAWLLLLATLVFGLAIPMSMIARHRAGKITPWPLPDDRVWSSGPLSASHTQAAGDRCAACHQLLFVHVQNAACAACHKTTLDHVSKDHLALTRLAPAQRCGECHAEHLGDAARLALVDDGLCVKCHSASDRTFGSLKVAAVSGFQPRLHPPFSVALQRLSGPAGAALADLQWLNYRVPLADAGEQSNLKFSHAQHLDPVKVTNLSGTGPLGCADCHRLAADGEHFQ